MLNKKKQITSSPENKKTELPFFFNLPQIPQKSYTQTKSSEDVLNELKIIFEKKLKRNLKPFRFSTSLNLYRTYSLFTENFINQKTMKRNLQKRILFLKKILKHKKRYRFLFMKQIKGGYVTSCLGLTSFTPKILAGKIHKKFKKQKLLSFRFLKRKTKFSYKKFIKINIISSCKTPTNKKGRQTKTCSRVKKNVSYP